MKTEQVAIRLEEGTSKRFERIAQALTLKTGIEIKQSAALRRALERGADVLEEELGIKEQKT